MWCVRATCFRLLTFMAGFTLAVFACPDQSWSKSSEPHPRVALLIANARYLEAAAPRAQPRSSIRALADELRRSGFHVDTKQDLGKQELLRAIDEFARLIKALMQLAAQGAITFFTMGMM